MSVNRKQRWEVTHNGTFKIVKLRLRLRVRVNVRVNVKRQMSKLDPEVRVVMGGPNHPPDNFFFS